MPLATDPNAPTPTSTKPKNNQVVGQQDFLSLLVHQLQNQDPLNPMDSQQFAVQLAQFSQVEQLVAINQKLDSAGTGSASAGSLAGFLGQEVILDGETLSVRGGKAQNLLVDVPAGTRSIRVDLLNDQGQVVGSKNIDNPKAGEQALSMEGLEVVEGEYGTRIVSVDANGRFSELKGRYSGTVEGFIMGPDPKLIVNGSEVAVSEISEVRALKSNS